MLRPRENERAVLEDAAGIGHAEGPPNRAPFVRRRSTSRTDVTTEGGQVGNPAPAEALARNQARLHLGGIQPARVLRRVVDREALPKCAAAALAKCVAASLLGVRAQVVGDEVDAPGLRVRLRDAMQRASEVAVLAASRRVRQPPPWLPPGSRESTAARPPRRRRPSRWGASEPPSGFDGCTRHGCGPTPTRARVAGGRWRGLLARRRAGARAGRVAA